MKVSIFQMDISWEKPQDNINNVIRWATSLSSDTDLIVLPEMFATGFSMSPDKIAQTTDGDIVSQMHTLSKSIDVAIIFSAAINSCNRHLKQDIYTNRLFFIAPDGIQLSYDKRHLFRMGGEHNHYTEGESPLFIHYKGFRIMPLICYDLRFPVWSRAALKCDILIYIASWPEARAYAWSTLLRARAIENQCYTIGVNRCGIDPENKYSGDSIIIDYLGQPIAECTPNVQSDCHATLSLDKVQEFKKSFPTIMDDDKYQLLED